ncbi:MAG: oligosaccharide repeat unit polymerase [Acidimicrobiia bacterium]
MTMSSPSAQLRSLRRSSPGPLDPTTVVSVIVGLPLVVLVGDAVTTGVDEANVFAYAAIQATALLVGALVASRPVPFDLRTFKLGGIYVLGFELTMLIGTPSVFGEHARERSAAMFLASVCIAFVLTTAVLAFVPSTASADWSGPGVSDRSVDKVARALALVGLLVLGAYVVLAPVLPLVEVLSGARSSDLALAREQALTRLSSPLLSYLFGAVRDIVLPAASAVLLIQLLRNPGFVRFVRFSIVFLAAVFAAAVTTEKSPVGRLLLVLFLTVWIAHRNSLRWRSLLLVAVLFVGFPFAVTRLSNSPLNSNAAIASGIGERMLRVPPNVHYNYIAFVDEDLDQLLAGRTLPNIGKFATGPNVAITAEVQQRIFPNAEVQGNANGSYISNFYADFGMLGVVGGSIVTGVVIAALDRLNRRHLPMALGIPLQAVTAVQLLFLTSNSLFDSILQFPFGNIGVLAAMIAFVHLWLPLGRRVTVPRAPHVPGVLS